MDVCVFGTGAVGGYLAARLIASGVARVSLVARGPQLEVIRASGLTLLDGATRLVVLPDAVTDDPARLPPQDIVFVTLKAQAQPAAAPAITGLLKPGGHAVFVANGIPWWLGLHAGRSLPDFAPGIADLMQSLGARSLGCVAYSNNEIVQPGMVRHLGNNRWLLGEYDGELTPRLTGTCAMLGSAELDAVASPDIRSHVWRKLARNVFYGPICALTRADPGQLHASPGLRELGSRLVGEVAAVATAWGWEVDPVDATADTTGASLTAGLPSMLQDVLAGREVEVDALLDRVRVLAAAQDVATPALDTMATLLQGWNAAAVAAPGRVTGKVSRPRT